jgi:CxC5 like cysteine cluster associated with KDZ transposases
MSFVFVILKYIWFLAILAGIALLPTAHALPSTPFPDILFTNFSQLIQDEFGPDVTLTTVLTILLSLTSNPELLNLHARQQNPNPVCSGEIRQSVTGWMKAFVWSLQRKLGNAIDDLFHTSEGLSEMSRGQRITAIGKKMDNVIHGLGLYPYNQHGRLRQWIGEVDNSSITPIRLLCPSNALCVTHDCQPRALHQDTREANVAHVTLVQGTQEFCDVAVLTARCPSCQVSPGLFYYVKQHNSSIVGVDTVHL